MARDSRWSWRTRQVRRDEPEPRGGARPYAHFTNTEDDATRKRRRQGAFGGPRVPAQLIDAGTQFAPGGGGLYDVEPRDHVGTDIGIGWDERPGTIQAHQADFGAVAVRQKRPNRHIDGLSAQTEARTIEPGLTGGSRAALVRGDNSLPENNPDGYRLGTRVFRWNDRRMYKPRIVHTDRPVPTRTVPDPVRGDSPGGVLTSPFPFGAIAKLRNQSRPLVRRVPSPSDQAATVDDGSVDNTFTAPQFWTSGAFGYGG